MNGWWPQGGGEAQRFDSEWGVRAFIGQPQDIGSRFILAAIVVSEEGHNELSLWVKRSDESGDYRPRGLPQITEGCSLKRVTVIKRSH